jgi:hypothetical protein
MKNKKIMFLIAIILFIIAGILILVNSKIGKESLSRRDIRKITKEFYSFYYDENNTDDNVKNYLRKYINTGLTISLGDMEIYIENKSNGGTTYSSLEKCDRANSKITIYPKSPFGKDDYELKFDLVCY